MARKLLKINDSAWLFAESRRTPMQVGLLATFSVPPGEPTFVADLVARWRTVREFRPPYNYLFKRLPLPRWSELADDRIDVDYHLRHSAMPAPGSQRELGVLVSRLHSSSMDRRYPLWEVHVIEGLEEDRWALYAKAHHSQFDGVGGVRLLKRTLSADPEARDLLPPWAIGADGPDQSGVPPRVRPTTPVVPAPRTLPVRIGHGLRTTARVGRSLANTYGETLTGHLDADVAAPFRAPKAIFNTRVGAPRRFATQSYSVERLKAIAAAAEVSLNDVFLAACGGALRRYLLELGELPVESLTANVPVSVGTRDRARVGTAVTFLFARLGTDVADPLERLTAISASTALGKIRLPQVGAVAMDVYTAALMLPFLVEAILGAGGRRTPAFNLVLSNVPGPREPRYLDGSRMEELFPVSLLFNGQALNITAVSYDGQFNVGFTGCRDSVPSLQRIAVYSGQEISALEVALGLV